MAKTILFERRNKSLLDYWVETVEKDKLLKDEFEDIYVSFLHYCIDKQDKYSKSLIMYIPGKEKFAAKVCDHFDFSSVAEVEGVHKFIL